MVNIAVNNESRQSFLGPEQQAIYENCKIAVVGNCGGGSHVVQQLTHIGFKRIVTVDFDVVEGSNLPRMIGSEPNDAEEMIKKVLVMKRMIKRIQPEAQPILIDGKWQSAIDELKTCSIIVGCLDSIIAKDELEKFCRRFLIVYIDIGMDVHEITKDKFAICGQVAVSRPFSPCLRCMGLITHQAIRKESENYGAAGGAPQVVWPNGILASTAVAQVMATLLPWSSDLKPAILLEYDGNRMTLSPSPKLAYLSNIRCRHFSEDDLGDPFYSFSVATNRY